jgi:hypothetical protein
MNEYNKTIDLVVHPDDYKKPSEVYREVHGDMLSARILRQLERCEAQLDALLNHCDKEGGECSVCAQIICPHKESLHFHHDGCPACVVAQELENFGNFKNG